MAVLFFIRKLGLYCLKIKTDVIFLTKMTHKQNFTIKVVNLLLQKHSFDSRMSIDDCIKIFNLVKKLQFLKIIALNYKPLSYMSALQQIFKFSNGYIYLATTDVCEKMNIFKLGKTRNLNHRLCTYNTFSGCSNIFYTFTMATINVDKTEKEILNYLKRNYCVKKEVIYDIDKKKLIQIIKSYA